MTWDLVAQIVVLVLCAGVPLIVTLFVGMSRFAMVEKRAHVVQVMKHEQTSGHTPRNVN